MGAFQWDLGSQEGWGSLVWRNGPRPWFGGVLWGGGFWALLRGEGVARQAPVLGDLGSWGGGVGPGLVFVALGGRFWDQALVFLAILGGRWGAGSPLTPIWVLTWAAEAVK